MRFATLSVLSLAALAAAAPHPQESTELEARIADRGLTWTPRSLQAREAKNNKNNKNNNNNEVIQITETEVEKLTETQRGQDVQLTVLVEKKVKIVEQKRRAQDNIRKNHYRNKNTNQNTVIVVVTQIVDIRDKSNVNTRFLTRQIKVDNGKSEDKVVVVSEIKKITIDGSNGGNGGNGNGGGQGGGSKTESPEKQAQQASATAAAAASITTYDASAPFAQNNQTQILPSGAAAPNWGEEVDNDPGAIAEDNQEAYVQFGQSS